MLLLVMMMLAAFHLSRLSSKSTVFPVRKMRIPCIAMQICFTNSFRIPERMQLQFANRIMPHQSTTLNRFQKDALPSSSSSFGLTGIEPTRVVRIASTPSVNTDTWGWCCQCVCKCVRVREGGGGVEWKPGTLR
jgi:hypothetical protein